LKEVRDVQEVEDVEPPEPPQLPPTSFNLLNLAHLPHLLNTLGKPPPCIKIRPLYNYSHGRINMQLGQRPLIRSRPVNVFAKKPHKPLPPEAFGI
jgi:hypothetical protein